MPESFSDGETIPMENGGFATVIGGMLGSGGQGQVYKVEYSGKNYALKWYTAEEILVNREFRENIDKNIKAKSPSKFFVWPLYLTKWHKDSYGYLMELIPNNYEKFSDVLRTYKIESIDISKTKKIPVYFNSTKSKVIAALHVIEAFRKLHKQGKSYQDLNDGGLLFDTKSGDVLICDCDNVAPDYFNFGIQGKQGYEAPEVVSKREKPNVNSDRFSLAIILFKLLFNGDPFVGKKVIENNKTGVTDKSAQEMYANPLFIFNPKDRSNEPDSSTHKSIIALWGYYPQYVRDAFIRTFTDGITDASKRLIEMDWFRVMMKLYSETVECECGKPGSFISTNKSNSKSYLCPKCGKKYDILEVLDYKMPMVKNNVLWPCHLDRLSEDYTTIVSKVVENKNRPGVLGLKNFTEFTWNTKINIQSKDTFLKVKKDEGVMVASGLQIDFGNGVIGKVL